MGQGIPTKAFPLFMSRTWHSSSKNQFNVFSYDAMTAEIRTNPLPDAREYLSLLHVTCNPDIILKG